MPKISIITVNLNNLEGLQRTMESVFEQSWQEFEYLVIDGDSTDGSKEFIEKHNKKIDYWLSEPDNGIYNAMNKGIKAANGEYLLFLNSGDELYNLSVLKENKDLIHTEDLVYFNIFLIFQGRSEVHNYPEILSFRTFMEGSIGHPTTFIKRNLFAKIGLYDEKLRIVADWKFFAIAVVKNKCSQRKIDAVLSKFYMDGVSSTEKKIVDEERKLVIEKNFTFELFLYRIENSWGRFRHRKINRYIKRIKQGLKQLRST